MRRVVLAVVLLAVLAGVPSPGVGAGVSPSTGEPAGAIDDAGTLSAVQAVNESARTEIVVEVQPDANATWTVRTRYELETENDTRAFNRLVGALKSNATNATGEAALFRNYAEQASNATGREMRVTDVGYEGDVRDVTPEPNDEYEKLGVLTLSFTWTNFAATGDGGRLQVGDAFSAPDGGLWFPSLAENQRLVFVTPEEYTVERSISSETNGNRRIIDDARRFERGVWFVYAPEDGAAGETTPPQGEGPFAGGVDPLLVGGGLLLLALLVAAAYVVAGRDDEDGPSPDDGGVAGDGGGTAVESVQQDDFDLSLLSDEERVEYLLERNGGRMRQAAIVEGTGWSDAKVSQLLSTMADDDRVNKLRIGRENLISLPGHDPADDPSGSGGDGGGFDADGPDDADDADGPDGTPDGASV